MKLEMAQMDECRFERIAVKSDTITGEAWGEVQGVSEGNHQQVNAGRWRRRVVQRIRWNREIKDNSSKRKVEEG